MEEVLRRIRTLKNRVDSLIHREEHIVNKHTTNIQKLKNIKEIITTVLNNIKGNNDKIITSISLYKGTQQQHEHPGAVTFILELLDGRIAVSCGKGSISLNQMNYQTKKWKVLTHKDKAHDNYITSLCELSNKRIVSSSWDKTIKVWSVLSNNEIEPIKTISQHEGEVRKVIALTGNRFASCSNDDTVKLYNSETYEQIQIPFEQQDYPNSLLQLKRQSEVLVINSGSPALHFYQLSHPYKLLGTVNGVCTVYRHGLIELSKGHVVASRGGNPPCIYIVDPQRYKVIATIVDEEYIPDCGSLYAFGNNSFIYVSFTDGCLCEVSMINEEYKITFKTKKSDGDLLGFCICLVNDGKYLISSNRYYGCSIFNCRY